MALRVISAFEHISSEDGLQVDCLRTFARKVSRSAAEIGVRTSQRCAEVPQCRDADLRSEFVEHPASRTLS